MAKGTMGGNNLNNLMKQAQKMQMEMQKAQKELEEKRFEGQAGGGAVRIELNGKKEMLSVEIEPGVADPDDVEMLQDLIMAAYNQAAGKIDEETQDKMGGITGGMKIPGF
ncbi:MAG: YbaB/EbfC family nucleoid-associated protein [Clostridia bacterium]